MGDFPSFFEEEVARFSYLAGSGVGAFEIEAARGFGYLGHHAGEGPLVPLAGSKDSLVRLAAVKALGVCGRRRAVAALVEATRDADYHVRRAAGEALARMTGQGGAERSYQKWHAWLSATDWPAKETALLKRLAGPDAAEALAALRAIRFIGSRASEGPILARLGKGPALGREGHRLAVMALERVGTAKSLPFLIAQAPHYPETSWALAQIGGLGVEDALLAALGRFRAGRLDAMVNLDRVKSRRCGDAMPMLLQAFGLVMFRSQTDELQRPPGARQRLAANLILRTGQAQKVVHLILAQCEGKRKDADTPAHLRALLAGMRKELAPGFVRSDGHTVAQPLAALPLITKDRRFIPRLIALLNHRAFIVRIYAAHTLGEMKATEAVGPLLKVIRQPYPFVDATTLASGKHFGHSQAVRWRGYVCMGLGRLGGEPARKALEELAGNPKNYRDIRYGAVVGLGRIGSPASLPALKRIARTDIIWTIRRTAAEAAEEIELTAKLPSRRPAAAKAAASK